MSVALHGNLRDFGIGEVFQLIGQQQKTGLLEVSDGDLRLRIAFDGGAVVSGERVGAYEGAAVADMLVRAGLLEPERLVAIERQIAERGARLDAMLRDGGEVRADQLDEVVELVMRETVFELLRWTRGSFHFSAASVAHDRTPAQCIPAEQLLMDGLRMVDEWRSFDEGAVDPEAVFEPTGRFEEFRRAERGIGPDKLAVAERLFLLIDGGQPVARIRDLSRLGSFETAHWLSRFVRAGLIERMAPEVVARKPRRRHGLELTGSSLFGAILAALPWLLLGVVGLGLAQQGAGLGRPAPRLGEQQLLHGAEVSFETLRVRHLADAYRYARGEWPTGMTDLRRFVNEARREHPLAPLAGHEYYFAQRGDSFLVLAPEDSRGAVSEGPAESR